MSKSLLKDLIAERNKVPRHKLAKTVTDKAKQALEADCKREFGVGYDVVLRRSNRALRLTEREEQPDETDVRMMVFLAERQKVLEVVADRLGIEIKV